MKIKLFLVSVFLVITSLGANQNPFILSHDELLDQRAQEKIFEIGTELKSKLNVNLYVNVKEDNGINRELPREEKIAKMKQFEQNMVKDLPKPYAVLAISVDQIYTNILMSEDLQEIIDRDDILDGYVIPLLASKDKNTLFAKTSAAALNGFAQMADSVAASQNIKLESSIGSQGKVASTIWKVFMYSLVLGGIILYAIIVMREKKYRKEAKNNGTRG